MVNKYGNIARFMGCPRSSWQKKSGFGFFFRMSHIETGNTKLSLQVFVDITRALDISADDLLSESTQLAEWVLQIY